MTPEEKEIAIATLCGWTIADPPDYEDGALMGHHPVPDSTFLGWDMVPDYLNSLDAITSGCREHITEKVKQCEFSENLIQILNRRFDGQQRFLGATPFHVATAEPDDLCSAFLLTLG